MIYAIFALTFVAAWLVARHRRLTKAAELRFARELEYWDSLDR